MDAHLARIDQKVKKLITITWVVAGLLSFVSWAVGFYLVGWQYLLAPGTAGSSEV